MSVIGGLDTVLTLKLQLSMMRCEEVNLRLGKLLLWISATEIPDDDNIPWRAVRPSEVLAVDFRRRISAR